MAERTCSEEGCNQKHWSKGLCSKHYQRQRRAGSPQARDYRNQQGRQPAFGLAERTCPVCGKTFRPYRDNQRSCSRQCYTRLPDVVDKVRVHHAQDHIKQRKNAARRERWATEPERRAKQQAYQVGRLYGLAVEQYNAMLQRQDGRCVLCGKGPNPNGIKAASRLHVDHDHETGKVRALLCNGCNRGIGYLNDDPALLRAAADYIDRHRS